MVRIERTYGIFRIGSEYKCSKCRREPQLTDLDGLWCTSTQAPTRIEFATTNQLMANFRPWQTIWIMLRALKGVMSTTCLVTLCET